MHEYESKLGLISKFTATEEAVAAIDSEIDRLMQENRQNGQLTERLERMKSIIDKINE